MMFSHIRHSNIFLNYGTAGFRTRAELLDHVMYRSGLLAALRSKATKATIGLMVTASHNPEEDNGVKLVDPLGEMLTSAWEVYATQLANASNEDLTTVLKSIIELECVDVTVPAHVVIGRDTRKSSEAFSQAASHGAQDLFSTVTDYGLLTTPQLHYMVRCSNDSIYGFPTEESYYNKLMKAYIALNQKSSCQNYKASLTVDCANGVGALKVKQLVENLSTYLNIVVANDGSLGALNHQCGADYVKIQQCTPQGISPKHGESFASFDGDADRIVYFYFDEDLTFHLLDGDKIATLIASYLLELVHNSGLSLNLGIVQTAYANGSSTRFIKNTLGVEVSCVCTGVKHLHSKAHDYDIGVYFEANGHGTVLFNNSTELALENASKTESLTDQQKIAINTLKHVVSLINQTVGDAMSDMLLVETILRYKDLSLSQWDAMYQDFPSRQVKVKVKDHSVITVTDADRKVVTPEGLQSQIDALVRRFSNGRSFVRPSGTEDVVRVYAEADTQVLADQLASQVANIVYLNAGGIGEL